VIPAALGVKVSVSIITKQVRACPVTIKLVDGSVIHGKVNLHRNDVEIGRVSDLFTKIADPFIVVFDVTAASKTERVMIINKHNIIWIVPEEEYSKEVQPPHPEDDKPKDSPRNSLLDRLRSS
jgi:rRNA processing protein Gar1